MSKLGSWLQGLQGILRPTHQSCVQCNQPAVLRPEWLGFCRTCAERIPWIREIHCSICGRYEKCHDCERRSDPKFVMNRSSVQYNSDMKAMLARYKYRGDERLSETMANMLAYAFARLQSDQSSNSNSKQSIKLQQILTFVPLSPERQAERGFNQAELLARKLENKVNLPIIDLLQRTRHTDKQSFKSRSERLQDLENVFIIKDTLDNRLFATDIKIYIVDDVYTTGSTLQQCASVMQEAWPCARIYGLTWAR